MKKNVVVRGLVVCVIIAFVVAFFKYDLGQYLNLAYLKSQQDNFRAYYEQNQLVTLGAYFVIYVAVTALSLPGAAIMTLAGGALFGLVTGTLVVSFASTVGATLAFLVARFLFRDAIQQKFSDKLQTINEGVKKEGAFYLFTLRLIPAFPFFVINLVMGLTPLSTIKFFIISQLGMLPGTVVYVLAGTELSKIDSLAGILSPTLIFAFVLLGTFPLIAKKVIDTMKSRKYLKRYKAPKKFDYNMVCIGAGSGGLVSAYIAAAVKAKVALVEKHLMGGDCLNTGCVPSKALIRSAKMLSYIRRAKEFGFKSASVDFEFADVMERVQRVIKKVEPHDSVERYTSLGVECFNGMAKIKSPYEVEVNGKVLTTKNIVIATGGRPFAPPIKGIEKIKYLTSDTVWELRKLPKKFLVLGGGPIGSEIAQCFQRLGAQVSQVQRGPRLVPKEDADAAEIIMEQFRKEGMNVLTGHSAKEFVVEGDKKFLICEHQGKDVRVEFDEVLLALGRKANVKGFGLEDLEIQTTKQGTIEVDEFLRTNYPNIFAVGDVVGPYQFTHFAAHQAWYAAVNALFSGVKKFKADYRVIPWCTFTDPEIARVGLSEAEAKQKNIPHEVAVYGIDDLDRAIADEEDHGFVKILTVPGKDKILGVTIVGAHAGDIIVEFITAMKYNIGLNKILGTIHIYPTLGESNKYAAGVWKKAHAPEGALRWLQKFHSWRRGGTPDFEPPANSGGDHHAHHGGGHGSDARKSASL